MQEAIGAYRSITATPEFREKERLYAKARHDEAQALYHARQEGEKAEREKWRGLVADKDAALADKDAALAGKDVALADKETKLAEQAALIAELKARVTDQE
jgi:hypothetical protein